MAEGAAALSLNLRQLALQASPTNVGVSVRALSEHAKVFESGCATSDSQSLVQSLISNDEAGTGPAEVYVIHDATAPFSVTLASLVALVTPSPNSLDTCVWIDVACLPRPVSKTRSVLADIRKIMGQIGRVVVCSASLAEFAAFKQSW
jgi:hypothetical protein